MDRLLAYHDRSDGGLLATLAEMLFAGGCGLTVLLDDLAENPLVALFAEELGAVLQVRSADRDAVMRRLADAGLGECSHGIGAVSYTHLDVYKRQVPCWIPCGASFRTSPPPAI